MQYISKIDQHITHMSALTKEHASANIIIIHGMAEHRFRYDDFMHKLHQNNFNVFSFDLRGHGESLLDNTYGYFAKEDGYLKNIEDIHGIINMIQDAYPLKTFLFGHSMGSLFARGYLKMHPNTLDALVLSGSPYPPFGVQLLNNLLKLPAKIAPKSPSCFIYKMMNQSFNKGLDAKTDLDWMSFDEDNIEHFQNDTMCNFPFTLSAYVDLFNLMKLVYQDKWDVNPSDMPILFVAGEHDPCIDFKNDGLNKAIKKLKDAGYENISSKIYHNSRHELLNDLEKDLVSDDIINFYKSI